MRSPPLLLGLLLTIATTCDARMIIGTEAQEDSLRDQLRSLSERLVSRDQYPCSREVTIPEKCVEPLHALPDLLMDIINVDLRGFDVDDTFCSPQCSHVYADKIGNFTLQQTSPGCDGTLPSFLFYGDGLTGPRNKALLNAMQDVVCLKNPAGQRCASPGVLGKTLDDSGLTELLRNPPRSLKKVLEGLIGLPAGQSASAGDIAAVLAELGPQVPTLCAAASQGSCCVGSFVEFYQKVLPSICGTALSDLLNGVALVCLATGNPLPASCGGIDYTHLGTVPSECPDAARSAIMQVFSLTPVASTQYAACTLPPATCPRDDCELLWCTATPVALSEETADDP